MSLRRCTRTACARPAIATLTYVYADQTAVLGPLAIYAEPHTYDLCEPHAERLSAPRGWEVVRLAPDPESTAPSHDDLEALADAVREAARPDHRHPTEQHRPSTEQHGLSADGSVDTSAAVGRRGHLRVLGP